MGEQRKNLCHMVTSINTLTWKICPQEFFFLKFAFLLNEIHLNCTMSFESLLTAPYFINLDVRIMLE